MDIPETWCEQCDKWTDDLEEVEGLQVCSDCAYNDQYTWYAYRYKCPSVYHKLI